MVKILIVDDKNKEVGTAEIANAHKNGLFHRIVRVFLFNSKGEMFLQQRSYQVHSAPGLWDQSVGGHVDAGETNLQAAKRETSEEIGLADVTLHEIGTYYTESGTANDSTWLRRFNTLYTAVSDDPLVFDPHEVAAGRWLTIEALEQLIHEKPEDFTGGLALALQFYQASDRTR